MSTGELACTYACLILHDDGIDITAEKISTLVKAANLNIEPYWPSLFAKLCQNRNIEDLIMNTGADGSSCAAPMAVSSSSSASAAGGASQAAPAAEQKKKEEVKEESEDDMVFGLFD